MKGKITELQAGGEMPCSHLLIIRPLLGDQGSGFDIGLCALRAVVRAEVIDI